MIVSVVAGGWSVSQIPNLSDIPGKVIAVNDAAVYLPTLLVDEIVSMDRLWAEGRWSWLDNWKIMTHIRRSAMKKLPSYDKYWLRVFDCDETSVQFGNDPDRLNGTNSGTCALARAYQLRPSILALFGFDMRHGPNGERHWYPDYPWAKQSPPSKSLSNWAKEFKQIKEQFDAIGTRVLNVNSPGSLIPDFKVVNMDRLLELVS